MSAKLLVFFTTTLVIVLVSQASGERFRLEAELYAMDRMAIPRSNASGKWAVHFFQNEVLTFELCVQKATKLQITNVVYSNDGDQDFVVVKLNGRFKGTFRSIGGSNKGENWNWFHNSTYQFGPPEDVLPGHYHLELFFVSSDMYGIEIDFVEIDMQQEGQDKFLLQCTSFCDSSINYNSSRPQDNLPSGWLVQQSKRTVCAEDKNVKVEVYHPSLKTFIIAAHPPKYRALLNNQEPDLESCGIMKNSVWLFNDFDLIPWNTTMGSINGASLSIVGDNMSQDLFLNVSFPTSGLPASGEDAVLRLKFRTMSSYFGHVYVSSSTEPDPCLKRFIHITTSNSELSWDIDAEFLKAKNNQSIVLRVLAHPHVLLHVEYLRLDLIPKPQVSHEVYADPMTYIQVLKASGASSGMEVFRPDTASAWQNVTTLTLKKRTSWSDEYDEVLQLHQDGTLQLKHLSSFGSESNPFGTAVIIGPSPPNATGPAVFISRVDVDPWALKLTVTFGDGSVNQVLFRSGFHGVSAAVSRQVVSDVARDWPFAVVSSSWVAEGKATVDHVSANGAGPRDIIYGWQKLYGTSFAFFRQCVSRYKSQAPDITLDLISDEAAKY